MRWRSLIVIGVVLALPVVANAERLLAIDEVSSSDAAKMERTRQLLTDRHRIESPAASGEHGAPTVQSWTGNADEQLTGSGMKMLRGLALTVGVLLIGFGLYRRFGGTVQLVGGRRIRVIERVQISAKNSLILVNFDGKEILLSAGPESARAVCVSEGAEGSALNRIQRDLNLICDGDLKLSA